MGGLRAQHGFRTQAEYAAFEVARRLADRTFGGVWLESTDDVTFWRQSEGQIEDYDRHQVKDHQLAPSEFREAVEGLRRPVAQLGGIPDNAVLAATSFSPELHGLDADLVRVRGSRTAPGGLLQGVLDATEADLEKRLRRVFGDREDLIEFSSRSLTIRVASELTLDERHKQALFASVIREAPVGRDLSTEVAEKIFRPLVHFLDDSVGTPLQVGAIEKEIARLRNQLSRETVAPQQLTIGCWEIPAQSDQYSLNWTPYFDRSTTPRRVPTLLEWKKLRGQLTAAKERIVNAAVDRTLVISGRMSLGAALIVGHTFPRNAGFTLRMDPSVGRGPWDTETPPDGTWVWANSTIPAERADGLQCVIIGVNQVPTASVLEYSRGRPEGFGGAVVLAPVSGVSDRAIQTSAEATAASSSAIDVIRRMHQAAPRRPINLFYVGPAPLALLLGQLLHAVGEVHLFEYDGVTYQPALSIT